MQLLAMVTAIVLGLLSSCASRSTSQLAGTLPLSIEAITTFEAPSPRAMHSAAWTGSGLIIAGGILQRQLRPTPSSIYYPATLRWQTLGKTQPADSYHDTELWTGKRWLSWGGISGNLGAPQSSGFVYNPDNNEWKEMNEEFAPSPRSGHSGVWTGKDLVIWGGDSGEALLADGGLYNLGTDEWRKLPEQDYPERRAFHSGAWTGKSMLIWGGLGEKGPIASGYIWTPDSDRWKPMAKLNEPSPRYGHVSVWTGDRLIVWGGRGTVGYLNDGGIYDPEKNQWEPMADKGMPQARDLSAGVWTGKYFVVWGGRNAKQIFSNGGVYHPGTKTWWALSSKPGLKARYMHTLSWTESDLIVWGGRIRDDKLVDAADAGVRLKIDWPLAD